MNICKERAGDMKNNLLQLLQDQGDLTAEQILTRIGMTLLLGLLIFFSYAISGPFTAASSM